MTESSFRRLLLRFALLPIFSLCVFLFVSGVQLRNIAVSRLVGAQSTAILLQSSQAERSMISEETGIRGYLATNDPAFLEPYHEGVSRVENDLAQLKEASSGDPGLSARISAISDRYRRFEAINQSLLKERLTDEATAGLLHQEKTAMDQLRVEFADLDANQTAVREANRRRITEILRKLPAIGITGGVLIAIVLIWYGRSLFREITRAYRQQLNATELQRDSLETTLHSIGDAVMVCDEAGNITMLNPVAESLTGWSEQQAVGRPLPEVFHIIHEHTRRPVENPVDKVRRLNAVVALENHTMLIRKDGAEIPIDDSGAPIRNHDGHLTGVVLVFRNVAERRQAANLLRASQARLNSIYNTTLEYIYILSLDGKLLECNRASLEFAGNKREDLLGQLFWDCPWFIHTPGMPEIVRDAIQKAAKGAPQRREMALRRPTGEIVNFDFSLSPVLDAEGNVTYLVPEGRDISELKRAEQALVQSEKLAAVGRLAASIAHEINNPLESVTNLIYLAKHDSSSPEISRYLDAADHELRRVSVIVSQTLRFHKQSSNPEPIQASDLFATVLSIYEGRLRNSQISVEVIHRTDKPVVCFAGDVRQVLNNLVANAIDAINRKGRLLMRSHASTDWKTGRKGITLTVADTGAGIASKDLARIFEPFFTTKGIGGTGLGLWVSKEVVLRHQGALTVRSCVRPQKSGTVFRFFLPYKPEHGSSAATLRPEANPSS